jgi:hypothetical protein
MSLNFRSHGSIEPARDGNSDTGTRPDGYGDNFLPVGGTRTRPELRRVRVPNTLLPL